MSWREKQGYKWHIYLSYNSGAYIIGRNSEQHKMLEECV